MVVFGSRVPSSRYFVSTRKLQLGLNRGSTQPSHAFCAAAGTACAGGPPRRNTSSSSLSARRASASQDDTAEDTKEGLAEDKKIPADLNKNCELKKTEWAESLLSQPPAYDDVLYLGTVQGTFLIIQGPLGQAMMDWCLGKP